MTEKNLMKLKMRYINLKQIVMEESNEETMLKNENH